MYFARSSRLTSLLASANALGTATAQVLFAGAAASHVIGVGDAVASSALAVSYVSVALLRTAGSTFTSLCKPVAPLPVYSGYTSICLLTVSYTHLTLPTKR